MANRKYTVLFGGGAVRGLAYIGALRALEELQVEYDILGGSSVGSVFATLVACGYKSYEIESIFMKINFELFRDIHFGFGKSFALSRGEIFTDWLNDLISKKIPVNDRNAEFKDIETPLVVITTNLKQFNTQEFSQTETPDFEVAKALRISSSMPGLMPPYNYNGADLVDGDLQKASPMWKLSKELDNSPSRILEFRLEGDCSSEAKNPISFINTIYSCVTDIATNFVSDMYGQNDRYDCIKINTGDIFFADFSLDKESRRELINSGYEQTMKYFKEILPVKLEKLASIYSQSLKYLKQAYRGLKANDVEDVQWWLGDLFTLIYENKEMIDEKFSDRIVNLKNELYSSISRGFLFRTKFSNRNSIEKDFKELLSDMDERLADIKFQLHDLR